MSKQMPPVPPANRNRNEPARPEAEGEIKGRKPAPGHVEQQGEQGNIRENTRNQGYQQDR